MDPKIRTVAVLGAGIMGNGISQTIAAAGPYLVYMVDVAQAILEQGLESIKKSLGRFTKKGEMTPEESEAIISRITPTTDFEVVQESDLVVEAIPEDLALKIETFQKLNDLCPTHAIMGTNTSSLPITSIAAATERPDMVIGIHFMNPVPVMKGVEVIKGLMTSPETVQATVNFVESIGKIPCLALDYAGFINSRLLSIYINCPWDP
jgi:3-hydroxybutyryl-CoA dehydrogenase